MTFDQILADLKKKIYHPVYFLQGEEPYFIDRISDAIEKNVLSDSEKEFNQSILYGKDSDILTVISYARRYPMMSNYQVVIVKEAQALKSLFKDSKGDTDPLLEYLSNPTPSTLLVFCYKYGKIDMRTKAGKLMGKTALVFESKKLYEDHIPAWINTYCAEHKMKINARASMMIAQNTGNDLSKISKELEKISVNLKPGEEISERLVEEQIGISKEYNIFEMQNAIGTRNIFKANRIAEYFAANPKANPPMMVLPQLYSYFMKVLAFHRAGAKSQNEIASELGVNPYFVKDYQRAAQNYSENHCIRNISYIREYDLKSKGMNGLSMTANGVFRELIYKILH